MKISRSFAPHDTDAVRQGKGYDAVASQQTNLKAAKETLEQAQERLRRAAGLSSSSPEADLKSFHVVMANVNLRKAEISSKRDQKQANHWKLHAEGKMSRLTLSLRNLQAEQQAKVQHALVDGVEIAKIAAATAIGVSAEALRNK